MKGSFLIFLVVFCTRCVDNPAPEQRHTGATQGGSNTEQPPSYSEAEYPPKPASNNPATNNPSSNNAGASAQLEQPPPVSPPADPACYKADRFICDVEIEIWRLTNQYRQQNGLSATTYGEQLSFASRVWSEQMQSSRSLGHSGFPNARVQSIADEFSQTDSRPQVGAENVAMFQRQLSDAQSIADEFVRMWINSPGHERNMRGSFRSLGVGVARSGNTVYATQIFGSDPRCGDFCN